jgi:hypothetical protein
VLPYLLTFGKLTLTHRGPRIELPVESISALRAEFRLCPALAAE